MRFVDPIRLNLLWLLIPLAGILVFGVLRKKKILTAFANVQMLYAIVPGFSPARYWSKAVLTWLGCGLAIIALAGPQWGFRWQKVTQKGVDIMIALDCSKSMLAQDIKPNRLEQAKREIIDLLRMIKSDRAGLVAFSGQAILQCPLTLDHQAFNIFLKVLKPGFLPAGGTNLSAAIQCSIDGFEPDSDTKKAIILITDGESTTQDNETVVNEAVKQGIKIFCIGVGDPQGAPIPDDNGGFKKDRSGNIVLSKVDEQALKTIASATQGLYVRSVAGDMDMDLIYTQNIQASLEKKTVESGKRKVWENRFQWFLFPGLLLLIIEWLLPAVKANKTWVAFALAFLFAAQPLDADARSVSGNVTDGLTAFDNQAYEKAMKYFIDAQLADPENQTLYYNIGTAAYMARQFELAERSFQQALKSPDRTVRHKALYNLANTQYQLGQLDDAIANYEAVLKQFPDDVEARENLEFVRQKKKEQEQHKKNNQGLKKQGNQNQEKDPDASSSDPPSDPDQGQSSSDKESTDQSQTSSKNNQNKTNFSSANQSDRSEDTASAPPAPRPAQNDSASEKQQADARTGNFSADPENRQIQQMLNRLEDTPGRAMIPVGENNQNDKDW
jgi:Ca-activated chloride channel family protein